MANDRALSLFTGFPGFIGARLLPRLLELEPDVDFRCLVQERFEALAKTQLAEMEAAHAHTRGRIGLVLGDITLPGLGLDAAAAAELRESMVEAWHLAAVYDLAVARDVAMKINVEGTRNVLAVLQEARRFRRHHYVSTAYVSGKATGVFKETDLDVGQGFKNFYEETKYLAEVDVVKSGLPTTIYRPGVVVGDSRTGETAKFDGPYYTLAAMDRLPSPGLFLRIGSGQNPVNIVPVDYVIEAMARLSVLPRSEGRTYHLTDPAPMTTVEVGRLLARCIGKSFAFLPVPLFAAKAMLAPGFVQRFLGMPKETLDYFDHPCRHDPSQARADLGPLGVDCPQLPDYAPTLVAFWRQQREKVRKKAMI